MCGGRDFAKQAMLHEPPAYLVVHLKRFDADGLKTSQNLPLRRAIADAAGAPPLSPLGVSVQGAPWSLYATVDHWGPSRHFGHYTARVKDPLTAQWWQCDDASVQRTGANDAYDEARSYLLFLEQGTKP
jgi:ubiquitin C-terminal hydrolase